LLFSCRSPATVSRLVIAVVIDPVDRKPFPRPLAHIGEEVPEIEPPLGDFNPSATVSRVARVFRIEAPLLHRLPGGVGRANAFSVVGVSVEESRLRPGGFSSLGVSFLCFMPTFQTASMKISNPLN
jgi:hypothetical protein